MTVRSLLWVCALALLFLPGLSKAGTFDDGAGAYARGDYAAAVQIWRSLAEKGNRPAQFSLGGLYARGQGVPRDDREALKWYRAAGESGYVPAQSQLAVMYDEGRGQPRNLAKAMKWYRRAAQQGDLRSQVALGLIYGTGRGVPQNYFQAEKWYRLAAEQGDALSQNQLGLIHVGGYGVVPKDDVQAWVWFSLAARGGNADAVANRAALSSRMMPQEVQRAERIMQDWLILKAQDKAARCAITGSVPCE